MNKGFSVALLSVGIALLSACSSTPEQDTTRTAEPVKKEEPARVAHILFFEHDSAAAPEDAADIIKPHADYLVRYPKKTVLIEGAADETGDEDYNYRLGLRRAEAVKRIFLEQGVDAKQLIVRSIGDQRPLNHQGELSRNRSVTLIY